MLNRIADSLWLVRVCKTLETFLAMKGRLRVGGEELRSLRFRSLKHPIVYRPGTTDISVAWELFRGSEYAVRGSWPFRTVLDCGANVGMFLAWLMSTTQLEHYVGVEADQASFEILERQIRSLKVGFQYSLVRAAVW